MAMEAGSIVEGKVTRITNFGAFVELEEGKVGLIHISEVADVYVNDVHDFLSEGDTVQVKIVNIDGNKIALSLKQAKAKPQTFADHNKGNCPPHLKTSCQNSSKTATSV